MAKQTIGIKSTPARKPGVVTEVAVTPSQQSNMGAMPIPKAEVEAVLVELPLGIVGEKEYLSYHVESRLRTHDQRLAMKRLLRGLQTSGAKTEDGRPVQRQGEVIRYVLERIAAEGMVAKGGK